MYRSRQFVDSLRKPSRIARKPSHVARKNSVSHKAKHTACSHFPSIKFGFVNKLQRHPDTSREMTTSKHRKISRYPPSLPSPPRFPRIIGQCLGCSPRAEMNARPRPRLSLLWTSAAGWNDRTKHLSHPQALPVHSTEILRLYSRNRINLQAFIQRYPTVHPCLQQPHSQSNDERRLSLKDLLPSLEIVL